MLWLWVRRRVLVPLRQALKNGISHKRLATSLALGVIIGLIPFYGFTTILVGVVAIALRLDFVIMQIIHYIVLPLQIALLIPFFKAGSFFITKNSVEFSLREYITLFKSDFWLAFGEFWKINLSAIIIWGIISIPLFILLHKIFFESIKRIAPVIVPKHFGKV